MRMTTAASLLGLAIVMGLKQGPRATVYPVERDTAAASK